MNYPCQWLTDRQGQPQSGRFLTTRVPHTLSADIPGSLRHSLPLKPLPKDFFHKTSTPFAATFNDAQARPAVREMFDPSLSFLLSIHHLRSFLLPPTSLIFRGLEFSSNRMTLPILRPYQYKGRELVTVKSRRQARYAFLSAVLFFPSLLPMPSPAGWTPTRPKFGRNPYPERFSARWRALRFPWLPAFPAVPPFLQEIPPVEAPAPDRLSFMDEAYFPARDSWSSASRPPLDFLFRKNPGTATPSHTPPPFATSTPATGANNRPAYSSAQIQSSCPQRLKFTRIRSFEPSGKTQSSFFPALAPARKSHEKREEFAPTRGGRLIAFPPSDRSKTASPLAFSSLIVHHPGILHAGTEHWIILLPPKNPARFSRSALEARWDKPGTPGILPKHTFRAPPLTVNFSRSAPFQFLRQPAPSRAAFNLVFPTVSRNLSTSTSEIFGPATNFHLSEPAFLSCLFRNTQTASPKVLPSLLFPTEKTPGFCLIFAPRPPIGIPPGFMPFDFPSQTLRIGDTVPMSPGSFQFSPPPRSDTCRLRPYYLPEWLEASLPNRKVNPLPILTPPM
jgi:hypothetical protein